MAWLYLGLAIAFEIAGTTCLKLSAGFTRAGPSLLMIPAYLASFALLSLAVRVIPISVAYAVWSAVGTAIIAAIGIAVFREPFSWPKLACIGLIIAGVVGLHLADRGAAARPPSVAAPPAGTNR
jgi:small multidrug resistance pump